MKLVENWKQAWRWFSVQALAAVVALPIVWPLLPADVRGWMPDAWEPYALMVVAAGGIIGRLVDQKKAPPA
jgi:hypothetical protein